jgi:predicted enzyme related to lactoylglutathione lyase
MMRISQVTIHVRDCDEAYDWYAEKLGFVKHQDETYADGTRWLTVASPDQPDLTLVLDQRPQFPDDAGIGKSPVFVIETDDCAGHYEALRRRGVYFNDPPVDEPWGVTARFVDLYGNEFHMYQPPTKEN